MADTSAAAETVVDQGAGGAETDATPVCAPTLQPARNLQSPPGRPFAPGLDPRRCYDGPGRPPGSPSITLRGSPTYWIRRYLEMTPRQAAERCPQYARQFLTFARKQGAGEDTDLTLAELIAVGQTLTATADAESEAVKTVLERADGRVPQVLQGSAAAPSIAITIVDPTGLIAAARAAGGAPGALPAGVAVQVGGGALPGGGAESVPLLSADDGGDAK